MQFSFLWKCIYMVVHEPTIKKPTNLLMGKKILIKLKDFL